MKRPIELTKVSGTQNPADRMTKNLAKEQIVQYTKMLGFEFTGGRLETTAKLHSVMSESTMRVFAGCARWGREILLNMSQDVAHPVAPVEFQGDIVSSETIRNSSSHHPPSSFNSGWQCIAKRQWTCRSLGHAPTDHHRLQVSDGQK